MTLSAGSKTHHLNLENNPCESVLRTIKAQIGHFEMPIMQNAVNETGARFKQDYADIVRGSMLYGALMLL